MTLRSGEWAALRLFAAVSAVLLGLIAWLWLATPAMAGATAFNPADATPSLVFSNGNLTVTGAAAAVTGARVADPQTAGKYYFEAMLPVQANAATSIGIADDAARFDRLSANVVDWIHGVGIGRAGLIVKAGSSTGVSLGAIGATDVICIALDIGNAKVWFRKNGGSWDATTDDPATNTGGIALTISAAATQGVGSGSGQPLVLPLYAAAGVGTTSDQVTANFGATAFAQAVPSGFTAGWPAVTLSPTGWFANGSKTVTFSGTGNLKATVNAGAGAWADVHYYRTTGKYAVEFTVNQQAGAGYALGLSNANDFGGAAAIGSDLNSIAYVSSSGIVKSNGATLATYSSYTTGDVVDLAIDLDHKTFWVRKNGGNWNGSAANDPAANTGGLDISGLVFPLRPLFAGSSTLNDAVTGNFGATPFVYAAPSGFIKGWPVGVATGGLVLRAPLTHW